jgi:folate-dependent phosphoribosylglycinamide formyltransferase PurN
MKLVLFSGTHARHLYVNRRVLSYFDEVMVIVMQREDVLPTPPSGITKEDRDLFIRHFENRKDAESLAYGELDAAEVFAGFQTIFVQPDKLNTEEMAKEIVHFKPDFAFIFGSNLILDPVIDILPKYKINLHLGLSPWYRGGATLYWPFYFLQPQFCGVTFHQITKEPDAGEIIHQSVPKLNYGDKIHDVAAKCVLQAADEVEELIKFWKLNREFKGRKQWTTGRNWRVIDFHPSQLRVIYDLFNDEVVDRYLDGDLEQRKPKLFSCLS